MKMYKIRHNPTGLYFCPSRGNGNFSKIGKIYTKKPSISWVDNNTRVVIRISGGRKPNKQQQLLIDYFNITYNVSEFHFYYDNYHKENIKKWEIVEID